MKLKNFCMMLDKAGINYTVGCNDNETTQCVCIPSVCGAHEYADFSFDMDGNLLAVNVGN